MLYQRGHWNGKAIVLSTLSVEWHHSLPHLQCPSQGHQHPRYWMCEMGMLVRDFPDSKVHGANMEPIWGRQDPGGPHVVPMNFVIRVISRSSTSLILTLWNGNACSALDLKVINMISTVWNGTACEWHTSKSSTSLILTVWNGNACKGLISRSSTSMIWTVWNGNACEWLILRSSTSLILTVWNGNACEGLISRSSTSMVWTMHHFVAEMCTHVHISATKWCIVGYGTDAFWDCKMGLMSDFHQLEAFQCRRMIQNTSVFLRSFNQFSTQRVHWSDDLVVSMFQWSLDDGVLFNPRARSPALWVTVAILYLDSCPQQWPQPLITLVMIAHFTHSYHLGPLVLTISEIWTC